MMKLLLGSSISCLLVLGSPCRAQVASDKDAPYVPNYVMPAVPNKSPATAFEKAREASILFTKAHCTLSDAHRQAILGNYSEANASVQDALKQLADVSRLFGEVSKAINTDTVLTKLNPDAEDRVNNYLKEYGFRRPTTYTAAFQTLSSAILYEYKSVSSIKFSGDPSDSDSLRVLTVEQGMAAELFNVTTQVTTASLKQ